MSNFLENRVNVVISAADIAIINAAFDTILTKIPANATLSDDERSSYQAIDVTNKVFAEDALTEAQNTGAGVINQYVNLTSLSNDLTLYNQSNAIVSRIDNVKQRFADVMRITGHESKKQADVIYDDYQRGGAIGIPNAQAGYLRLKPRYDEQGGNAGRGTDDNRV